MCLLIRGEFMATSEKKRVRIKATSTNQGGRPRTDLVDPFSNELIVGKVPKAKDGSLINDVAKDQWQETCKLLISRKQLKRNHLPIILSLCNAFAVTVMSDDDLIRFNYTKINEETGQWVPAKHVVQKTYNDIMLRCMAILRLDPKNELYNSLASRTEEAKSQYLKTIQQTYDEF